MTKRYTPPELGRIWGVKPEKVVAFIRSGELRAFNIASQGSSRPRFLIAQEAIEEFERRRAARPLVRIERRPRQGLPKVIEFFK